MKKILPLIFCFISIIQFSKAQYVTIPDDQFREFLQEQYPSCFNGASQMDTSCTAVLNATIMEVGAWGIKDFTGLQYFKSLAFLDCAGNSITSLTNVPGSVTHLDCSSNLSLITLSNLPNSLTYFNCSNNYSLTTLTNLPNKLTYLDCSNDYGITSLTNLPNSLKYLNCAIDVNLNSISQLPNSLEYFICSESATDAPSFTLPQLPSSLIYLDCSLIGENGTRLQSLPDLPNSLRTLRCNDNAISILPTLPNSLDTMDCSRNALTDLPILPSIIKYLNCSSNQIGSLPSLPAGLLYLDCSTNPLKNLPTSLPPKLLNLSCGYSQLNNLPALPDSLISLDCSGNKLSSLPSLPNSIIGLGCGFNKLTSLEPFPTNLQNLYCPGNLLTTLPDLPRSLTTLDCAENLFSSLPSLPRGLQTLNCPENINLYCLPALPDSLMSLRIDSYRIKCIPNMPTSLSIFIVQDSTGLDNTAGNYPLCNPTNNINHCQEFPVMNGNVFYDNNSNEIKDPNELYMPYVQLKLSDGDYTYTNSNGYYEIAATDYLGSYALAAYAPKYYKAVPVLMTYNFTTTDTLVGKDIAMQPTVLIDTMSINMSSYRNFARPGTEFPVVVNYTNIGTTTLSPNITLSYDNSLLTFDSSSNASVINNGNSLNLSQTGFVPGQSGSFIAYFYVKTNDILGDSVKLKAIAAANAVSVADSIATIVRSSFDPNEKEATPILKPSEVAKGKPIVYTIRFQNTGNDTAFNIVIADTLSNLLVDSTLQMISSSRPCKVTLTGNVVYFEFLNVLLPDNKTNDLGSNGYVSFSIQPKSSVTGGSISNVASIYFDYNAPVVTNTVTTLISDGTVPIRFVNFAALAKPGSNSILLYWNTTGEINTKSFIVQQSTDGLHFNDVATIAATGSGNNNYNYYLTVNVAVTYYRLKMIDINGHFTYSTVAVIKSSTTLPFITLLTNPARGKMTINASFTDNGNAKLINEQGAVVKEFILHNGTQTIDVSMLSSGLYYLQAGRSSLKVLISK